MRTCGHCVRHHVITYAFLAVFFFLVAYLWRYAITGDDLKRLHEQLLRIAILGYNGHTTASLVLGIVQAAVWGSIFGGILSIFEQGHECEHCKINVIVR